MKWPIWRGYNKFSNDIRCWLEYIDKHIGIVDDYKITHFWILIRWCWPSLTFAAHVPHHLMILLCTSFSRGWTMLSSGTWYGKEYVGDVYISKVPMKLCNVCGVAQFLTFINLRWPCLNAAPHKLLHLTAPCHTAFLWGEIDLSYNMWLFQNCE